MITAVLLADTNFSPAVAETAYLHDTTVLPRGPFADDGLDAVRFAEGAFRLLSDGAAYRSLNGAEWTPDPKGHRYFAGTRVGPLWFAEEDGVVFTSKDRISWRRIPAPGVPDAYGDGTFALLHTGSAEGGRFFVYAAEDSLQSWDSRAADLGAEADLLDHIGGRWVAVEGTELKASTDGAAWDTVDPAPGEAGMVAPLTSVQPTAGSGHVLILISYGTNLGPQEQIALHSDDLETWRVIEPFRVPPDDFPVFLTDRRIRQWGDVFHLVAEHVFHSPEGADWRVNFLLHTKDFEVFNATFTGTHDPRAKRFTKAYPHTAEGNVFGQSVRLELLDEEDGTGIPLDLALKRTAGGTTERIDLERSGPSSQFLTSVTHRGMVPVAATATTVHVSRNRGRTWQAVLKRESGSVAFDAGPSGLPEVSGFFSLEEMGDSMWAATRANGNGNAAIWNQEPGRPFSSKWFVAREVPPEACRFFGRVGEHLVMAGVRDGETVIEWTEGTLGAGMTWESHSFPESMPLVRLRQIGGEFFLVGSEFRDGTPFARVKRSPDLRNWETMLTSEHAGIAFRDIARVNGTWVVTRAYADNPDYEIDRSAFGAENEFLTSADGIEWTLRSQSGLRGIFTALPDGSVVDSGGLRTWDGVHWRRGHDLDRPFADADPGRFFAFNVFAFNVAGGHGVTRTVQRRSTRLGQLGEFIHRFHFNTIDSFIPVPDYRPRPWAFSPHERTALDNAADTEWGTFHYIGKWWGQWFYHDGFGYLYAPESRLGSYWYWSPEDSWLWIDHRLAHFFYAPAQDAWHYLFP